MVGELDGEITVFDGDRPSFAMLQRRMHVAQPAPGLVAAVPVTYVAFDLLRQARSLLCSPYAQRRALLDGLALAAEHVSVPLAFPGQARALVDASRDLGLEGVVLKRLSSTYQPGRRAGDWLKIRHLAAADSLRVQIVKLRHSCVMAAPDEIDGSSLRNRCRAHSSMASSACRRGRAGWCRRCKAVRSNYFRD